ncbi:GNAT family N-acetyltransferase [Actinokineospora iranica]|uniref:Ribosomal protein S18 acetylase RimI n=1 Tax=Actinokineospora iranica TaxID=1271860 RepID=A0A1G6QXK7_9PSEU|nr:GNAT family N-acetyltransferase [Actinokineospora iranica]SDC96724.1 Ribosomal protein S18 acetylase RimI [Actinokineospora iranica]
MQTSAVGSRIRGFEERFTKAQASGVVDLGWGYALVQSDYPASWQHNQVVVTEPVDPEEVVAAADDVLAGYSHRLVQVIDDAQGAAAAAVFAAAGYQTHERIVTMAHSGVLPERGRGQVEAVAFDELRPSLLRDWRADYPEDTDEQIAQLTDRVLLCSLGADVTFLAVRDELGDVLARGELYVADGVAQFENVVTRPESRGRGLGRQLVTEALHRSHDAGADLWYLIAEATGWPRAWYRRMGYRDIAQAHVFQRLL